MQHRFSRKALFTAFWTTGLLMVIALIGFSAYLIKEVPPVPEKVQSASGEVLYTGEDVVQGKAYFQEFDLQDYGTMLGMGAYLGPEFAGDFLHRRAEFLYEYYSREFYSKSASEIDPEERGRVKGRVIQEFRNTELGKTVSYEESSADAYRANRKYLVDFLVNGNREYAWTGGVIRPDEAKAIAAFIDWGQLVASTRRPGTNRTWSNNWPSEPLIDQTSGWPAVIWSLVQVLLLWTGTIVIAYIVYEHFLNQKEGENEKPLQLTQFFPSQKKLLKYLPVVALFFLLQTILGGYLAHIYTEPSKNFLISQEILPFNVTRALHTNLAIVWVAIGWLVGGLFIAPLVGGKDLRFPRLVDLLWVALLVVGGGGLVGIYLGATGHMRELWFWFGNEGREYLNLGRVWDTGLLVGLVLWFGMVYSTIRNAKENNVLVGTILWSAFGIATLYMAGMAPFHKIIPNYTVDDYFRWWVVHLWVELTFELFSAGVLAYLAVALGLVPRKSAERILLLELFLVALSGVLGVGHHYWWQGLDEYWIAVGSVFSALEPIPLVILMIEAWKQHREIKKEHPEFPFSLPFLWLAGSALLNWYGAGFLGMVANLPIVNYYSHGTYLIMPHGHVALLGAFGYISIGFLYLVSRSHAMVHRSEWSERMGKIAFWLVTGGVILFSLPTLVIGLEQTKIAFENGYFAARNREALDGLSFWLWIRLIPDFMIIAGALLVFLDLTGKTVAGLQKKSPNSPS